MALFRKNTEMPSSDRALPGRDRRPFHVPETHAVNGKKLEPPYPEGMTLAMFGLGCFWGAERQFWAVPGVCVTAVGYAGGHTPNPTYEEVCSGLTGHNEVVRVVFDPNVVTYEALLKRFWESHDPTQGMRQGNDVGTQYRSGIYTYSEDQQESAERSKKIYLQELRKQGYREITTEILPAGEFYFAEDYHQQYLHKVPMGYCGLGGTGVTCPVGIPVAAE